MSSPFLFVAGCPRSGTSFLQSLLISHPQIAIGLERFNLRLFDGRLSPDDFEPDRFFRVETGDTWYDDLSTFAWTYQTLRDRYSTARYRGDKVPRAFEHFDRLIGAFPDVRFIGLVRGVEAVAASYEKRRRDVQHWNPAWGAAMAVDHWNASLRAMLACADAAPLLPVVYEDLLASPESIVRIGEFLDVDPAPMTAAWLRMRRDGGGRPEGSVPADPRDPRQVDPDRGSHRRLVAMAREPAGYRHAWRTRAAPPRVVSKYFREDARAFDYRPWRVPGSPVEARGCGDGGPPQGRYVACIGSAATFGRLVERPFPDQLRDRLGVDVVNLGIGGARPAVFADDEGLAAIVRGAACVVVEAMSARGYATDLFVPEHAFTNMGRPGGDPEAVMEFVDRVHEPALAAGERARLERARRVCRAAWVRDMKRVAALAPGRSVLLYVSRRPPHAASDATADTFEGWSGGFPHHVDGRLLGIVAPLFEGTVTVVAGGEPDDQIVDRIDGRPLELFSEMPHPDRNFYYPTRAMHADAADALVPVIRAVLASVSPRGVGPAGSGADGGGRGE